MEAVRAEPLEQPAGLAPKGRWLGPALTVAGGLYAVLVLTQFPRWVMDDAYILFRYASNLAATGQPIWNVGGDRVEGYTGFLAMVLLAIGDRIGLQPEVTAHLIGVVGFALGAVLLQLLMRLLQVRSVIRGAVVLVYLSAPFLYTNSFSGLETMLFSSAVLASLYLFARHLLAPAAFPRLIALSGALLVTSLIRPEGVLLAAVVFGVLLVRSFTRTFPGRRLILLGLLAYVLPAFCYFIWRATYYGELLPNTFYVKASGGLIAADSLWAEFGFVKSAWLLPFLAVATAWLFRPRRPSVVSARPLSPVVTCSGIFAICLFAFYAHADLIQDVSFRFLVPLFALGLLAIGTGAERILPPFHSRFVMSWAPPALLVAAAVAGQLSALPPEVSFASNYREVVASEHIPAGSFLRSHLASTEWLAVYMDAGAIPYLSRLPSIDMGGLNDRILANQHLSLRSRLDYVFSHHPGAFVITSRSLDRVDLDSEAAAIASDPRFNDHYRLVLQLAPGKHLNGHPYYELVYVRNDLL